MKNSLKTDRNCNIFKLGIDRGKMSAWKNIVTNNTFENDIKKQAKKTAINLGGGSKMSYSKKKLLQQYVKYTKKLYEV
jgi:hypothetical protein